jgi:predicted transcriptional regulator
MNLVDGNHLRMERQRRRLSLHTLAAVVDHHGASAQQISCFENGGRLREEVISRIERALDAIEAIQRIIAPARLDGSDGVSLRAAVDAYHEGRFGEVARMAVPPQANPSVITY